MPDETGGPGTRNYRLAGICRYRDATVGDAANHFGPAAHQSGPAVADGKHPQGNSGCASTWIIDIRKCTLAPLPQSAAAANKSSPFNP